MKASRPFLSLFMLTALCSTAITSRASASDTSVSEPSNELIYHDYPTVRLRSLDKITARTMTFDAQVGSIIRFGDIYIKIQACRKPPAIEKSESAAFLQIWEVDKKQDRSHWIFSGWMFASSPALSAMDHPVYDVWVIDCLGKRIGGDEDEEGSDQPQSSSPTEEQAPNDKELPGEGEVSPEQAPAEPQAEPEQTLETQPTPQPAAQPEQAGESNPEPHPQPEEQQPEAPKPAPSSPTDQFNGIY